MAPKTGMSSAQKQALCVQWMQRSGVAHTFKDLEKALPQVASISGMVVKEYIQAMTDENMIRVEKIGSGNWYWSFLSDETIRKQTALDRAEDERAKAGAAVEELQKKVAEATTAREDDEEDMLMECGKSRASMTTIHTELGHVLGVLKAELATYSDSDPVEMEIRHRRVFDGKIHLEALTDAIYSMESWFKSKLGGEKATLLSLKLALYGDEYDVEAGDLRNV